MPQLIYTYFILTLIRRRQSVLSTRGKSTLYEGKVHSLRGGSLLSTRGKSTLYEGKSTLYEGKVDLSEGRVDLRGEGRLTRGR